uniref:Major facilitator superfamily (MFS) profile domain-containing protein n=1 Tax=Globisporangium ultimum (strain ATCC 200006 / CBS 805.95 / DAOM BR144) TaxID=431595 RepID=K3W6E3_GLOUD
MGIATDAARARGAAHNVRNTYIFTLFYWAARSILFQQVISGYIYVLTDSNQPVGMVKGIQGISQLAFSLPAGYLADHTRRDTVLKISGVIGLLGALLTFIGVEASSLTVIYVAFGLWGLFSAFQSPAMEALFADSIPHGCRSYPFMIKYNVSNVAQVIGPFLSILLFLYFGDVWRLQELRPVLIFGTTLAAIASVFLFRYNDDLALEDEHAHADAAILHHLETQQRARLESEPLRTPSFAGNDIEIEYNYSDVEDELMCDDESTRAAEECGNIMATEKSSLIISTGSATANNTTGKPQTQNEAPAARFLCLTSDHVPLLLFLSDFIISNGAGMTINFFPLFFMKEYGLSPIHVSILFLVQPIVVMILSYAGQRFSRALGRMPIIVSTRIASTVCLLCMTFAKPLHLQVALFLMRGGMMRCSQPLRRSVLMDFVRREVRARWNALEGISVFSYSGSAVIGGYLVDAYDYRMCFFITSFVYFAGLSLELFLLPLTRHAIEK